MILSMIFVNELLHEIVYSFSIQNTIKDMIENKVADYDNKKVIFE